MNKQQDNTKQPNSQTQPAYFCAGYVIPRSAFGGSGSKCWNCHTDAEIIVSETTGRRYCGNCGVER